MKLTSLPLSDLLAAFRSAEPTPGGGSAAALAGAVGASLLSMVAALPKPNATTEEDARRLSAAGQRCAGLARELETLIDQDSAAYDLVVGAYRMPKNTDAEKAARSEGIRAALRAATEAPLDVMRRCADALGAVADVRALGNANAASDVSVAEQMLRAGLAGARENVEINLGSLKDAAYVRRVREESNRLSGSVGAAAPSGSA